MKLLLLLLLASTTFSKSIVTHFGPVPEGEMQLADHFIKWLGKTKTSIQGSFYEFRDDKVVDAFIDAHNRGVKVQLIVDSDNFFLRDHDTLVIDYTKNNPFTKRLLDAGIEVVEDEKRSGLMHNKFAVRDGKYVWTGSYNLTNTGTGKNENNALEITSKKLANIYIREFNEMFHDRQFGIRSPSTPLDQVIMLGDKRIEVFFAPEDDPVQRIYDHVSTAVQGVYFMQFAMTADELGTQLIEKHNDGLEVRGIFDSMLYRSTGPYAEFSRLTKHGVPVVVYDSPVRGKMHHKVFIIDPEGPNPRVITGSLNASANGNKTNDENIIIIHDREITQLYHKQFKELFGRTSRVIAAFKNIKPVKAADRVDRITLMVSSNGVKTQKLNIQFPARWPVQDDQLELKIFRLQNGEMVDTTDQEEFNVTAKNLFLNSANLDRSGERALLMVQMDHVLTPEIPGHYNLYIKAKSPFQKYYPLKTQPTIEVLDPEAVEAPGEELAEIVLTKMLDRNYRHFERLMTRCENSMDCDLLLERSFLTKATQILQQHVLIEESEEAQTILNRVTKLKLTVLDELEANQLKLKAQSFQMELDAQ